MSAAIRNRSADAQAWLNNRVPTGYWRRRTNRVAYVRWLGRQLGFSQIDDWYGLKNRHFIRNRGSTLLVRVYRSSVYAAMRDYRPDVSWKPWLFAKTPAGYWDDPENRRTYMLWLERKLRIRLPEQWYGLDESVFTENGAAGLFQNFYGGSMLTAVREHHPDYSWRPWLFRKVPNGFWADPDNRRDYYTWLRAQLGFRSNRRWSELTREQVKQTGAATLLHSRFRGSMSAMRAEIRSCLSARKSRR